MTETVNPPLPLISRTAIFVAAGRAVGAREPDIHARNPDYLAEKLLGDLDGVDLDVPIVQALQLDYHTAMQDIGVVSNVRRMIVRTRFIDEVMIRALNYGATQVVVLGAGFDTHAYRFHELLARASIFEVDRPVMQALKQQRINTVLGGPPPNLTYVGIDFQHDDLSDVLTHHGYDATQQTFFILEGVTMYLPEESLRATIRFVAGHPPGSSIAFDFVYRPLIDMLKQLDMSKVHPLAKPFVERFLYLTRDEPWQFGFPLEGEREYLDEFGLELREVLPIDGESSHNRYLTRADGTVIGAEVIAAAISRMTARVQAAGQQGPAAGQMPMERMLDMQRRMAYQLAEAVVR